MLAQTSSILPDPVWTKAAESGFLAILILVLLLFLWLAGRAVLHRISSMEGSINRLAIAITQVTLGMTWLPKTFKEQAQGLHNEIHEAEQARERELKK